MARVLESPVHHRRNISIYHDDGRILGGVFQNGSMTGLDLYEMRRMFLEFQDGSAWAIYHLNGHDGSTGHILQENQAAAAAGLYVILDANGSRVNVESTSQRGRRRQLHFRDTLRARDRVCAITGTTGDPEDPYLILEAAHVFPISLEAEWNQQGFRNFVTDRSASDRIGGNKICSPQNGLLLDMGIHRLFDNYSIAINPRDNYKVIAFKDLRLGIINPDGLRLRPTATDPNDPRRVSDDLLWWHFRQAVLLNMKGAVAEPRWEFDLDGDEIGQIMQGPDPAERMEVELFSRLGP